MLLNFLPWVCLTYQIKTLIKHILKQVILNAMWYPGLYPRTEKDKEGKTGEIWNQVQLQDEIVHTYGQMIFNKGANTIQWGKHSLSE